MKGKLCSYKLEVRINKNETPYINKIIIPTKLYVQLTLQFASIQQFKEL